MNATMQRLDDFIDRHLSSFAKWDVLTFLADSRQPWTAADLSQRIGRPLDEITTALDELAADGLLIRDDGEAAASYSLNPDPPTLAGVLEFVEAIGSRDVRLQVLAHLLRRGGVTP